MSIGERVKERRKSLGLTQEELAKRLGNSSRTSICTVEKDREDLTTTRISKLADALNTTPAYLMGWTDDPSIEYNDVTNAHNTLSQLQRAEAYQTLLDESTIDSLGNYSKEDIEEAIRLYQLYQRADSYHRLAVEALLKEKQQES